MWCIMGGRRICCIVVVFVVDIREQRTRVVFKSEGLGLYSYDVDVMEDMT